MMVIKISISFILVVLGLASCNQDQAKGAQTPNIVFIIADDVSWNDIGPYGNKEVQTPNMDRIAREGIKFNNVYLTTSSCSPSRSSIISGRYPHNTGVPEFSYKGALPDEIPIFPELLQKSGYYTAHAGKWHIGKAARRGFEVIHDTREENGDGGQEMWVAALKERPKDKPFFMWFASYDAHRDWGPNKFSGTNDPDKISPPPYLANTQNTRKDLASYYDEITRLDYYVGKVEEELARQDVLDNTIILILSDNGRPFPRSKTRLYDSGIKTPFLVKWNNGIIKKGASSNSLISVIDIAPTLLALADSEVPPSFQGKSFAEVIKYPETKFRTYIFAEHNWHGFETYERMVRTKDFMYILNKRASLSNPPPSDVIPTPSYEDLKALRDSGSLTAAQADVFITPRPAEELFNCSTDSMQLVNVASMPAYEDMLIKLRSILHTWQKETLDSVPENLTKDWISRETGKMLENINFEKVRQQHSEGRYPYDGGYRGATPGKKNAITTTASGPF